MHLVRVPNATFPCVRVHQPDALHVCKERLVQQEVCIIWCGGNISQKEGSP